MTLPAHLRPLLAVAQVIGAVGDWLLRTQLDDVICRWAQQTGDDDE